MERPEPPRPAARWFAAALALYAVWTLATYLLEGRIRTLLRPEAAGDRLLYAVIANLAIGVFGTLWVVRGSVRRGAASPDRLGFRGARRTLMALSLGCLLGGLAYLTQDPPTLSLMVLLNGYAQAWVVSVAEVLVCWVAVGGLMRGLGPGGSRFWVALAWLGAAAAFAGYHFAHSPPFDTLPMVAMLGVVGLVTGVFFFGLGELYGTIVFHNFLAVKGVTQALSDDQPVVASRAPGTARSRPETIRL